MRRVADAADANEGSAPRRQTARQLQSAAGWGLTVLFAAGLAYSGAVGAASDASQSVAAKKKTPPSSGRTAATQQQRPSGLSAADYTALSQRFEKEVWPSLRDACLPCHGQKNPSQLLLPGDAHMAFLKLIAEGRLDPNNQDSIVERVSTTDKSRVMPPLQMNTPLAPAQKAAIAALAEETQRRLTENAAAKGGAKPDEVFPAYLLLPYPGGASAAPGGNTFLSMRQLRGKVRTIFGDDGRRTDPVSGAASDLLAENAYLFGGADWVKRFDESTRPTPQYLTGVDIVGRDVVARAYLARTGPFADLPVHFPSPTSMVRPTPAYREAITRLYHRVLFRDPTPTEIQDSFTLLQRIYHDQADGRPTVPQALRFALTVRDDQGRATSREVSVGMLAAPAGHALTSEYVNQNAPAAAANTAAPTPGKSADRLASHTLARTFAFMPGDTAQSVTITNEGTYGNVSVASVTLRGPLPAATETTIPVTDRSVRLEGAWKLRGDSGVQDYQDGDQNKGRSRIVFPVRVAAPGRYAVTVAWRRPPEDRTVAQAVPVEVVSRDTGSHLAMPTLSPIPPKGEAHFQIDETVDTVPYWDLRAAFRFGGAGDGIEIDNAGTRKRVAADAVRLTSLPTPGGAPGAPESDPFLLHAADAVGKDQWVAFKKGTFSAYNTIGPDIYQDMDQEGKKRPDISLRFAPPSVKTTGFDPNAFYQIGIIYPGQADNETRVPVVVRARESAPLIQAAAPLRAATGATVTLDASRSFDVQHAPLRFHWVQTGGPRVTLKDPTAPVLTFTVPPMAAQQQAWEGLCRALLFQPDFLFTRPRSLETITAPRTRRRLQLVKIAQDLVGRPPTQEEITKVDHGAPLASLVDTYLKSPEFSDFYFHRVRLYLESHGTPEQDEPARLWTYIMETDRPFKEILTANYTVDTNGQRRERPAQYGHTGLLTMKGFIEGKPGLPHFNYPAQVCEKFLGYVFEVPDEVVKARQGSTAASTTDPKSVCYSCHKILTPLAYQRGHWMDSGDWRDKDEHGSPIDATDRGLVAAYPFKGDGLEAFATQAQNKERFVRAILQTHFIWYWGREMRWETDERGLYHRLWDVARSSNYALRPIIRAMVLSPEYLEGRPASAAPSANVRVAKGERSRG